MVAYADSSFLTKLYLQEPASPSAIAAFGQVALSVQAASQSAAQQAGNASPVARISELTFLEVRNALNSAIFDKRISTAEAALALADFQRDIASGLLSLSAIAPVTFACAAILSDRYTPTLRTRTLDLLHLAAALDLGADTLLSFDQRQRQAAQAENLQVLP